MKKIGLYVLFLGLFSLYSCQKDMEDDIIDDVYPPLPTDTHPFVKGSQEVDSLYPINVTPNSTSITGDALLLLTTLQGIVAKTSATQIYFYSNQDDYYYPPDDEDNSLTRTSSLLIRNYLTTQKDVPLIEVSNPSNDLWEIVDYFKKHISGYILYDDNYGSEYRNMAVTHASIMNCIPIKSYMEDDAIAHNLKVKASVNHFTSYKDFIDRNQDQINPNLGIELDPNINGGPRDYAAMLGGMVFWTPGDAFTRTTLLNAINPGVNPTIPVFGWDAHDASKEILEYNFLNSVSLTGNFVVASDQSTNLSLLSSSNSIPVSIPNSNPATLVYDNTKIYVTFIMSDGDNLQLMTNNIHSKVWYGSPHKGIFPVGWSLPPAMYYLEPDVWNLTMSYADANDEFIAGPSTIGYVMGNVTNNSSGFDTQIDYLNAFLSQSGIELGMVFGDHVKTPDDYTGNYDYLDKITNSDLEGIFYEAYHGGAEWKRHLFVNEKPVAYFNLTISPTRDVDLQQQASDVNWALRQVIDIPSENLGNGFYPVYGVRNFKAEGDFFSRDLMGAFKDLYDKIQETNSESAYKDKIVVVKPSQFIDLMTQSYQQDPGRWDTR